MIETLESLYTRTVGRVPVLHGAARALVWAGGEQAVAISSRLLRFELPAERLLPLYQLQILFGTYESSTVRACRSWLRPGMTVIDVGAHVGYYTVLFSRLVGATGRVFAFEPHPANFELLSRNVRRRAPGNVSLHREAVSDHEGDADFWQAPLSLGHSLFPVKADATWLSVKTVSLDGLCRRQALEQVDLVKVDVEGAEPEVFAGMRETCARSPRLALLAEFKPELCARRQHDPGDWLAGLAALGFTHAWALTRHARHPVPVPLDDGQGLAAIGTCNVMATRGGHRPSAG
jgi:FkbM family methyltransferase